MKRFILNTLITLFIINSSLVYCNTLEVSSIGYSVNNREIELYKFGKGKNIIVIIAGIHGNESNTYKTAASLIDLLKKKKINIPYDKSIWIIPKANPDGLIRDRRLNDNDVDLNRNFESNNWKPSFYFFNVLLSAGKHPFSEPETIALKKLFESINKKLFNIIVLSLHSRGDLIIPGNKSLANFKLVNLIKNNSSYNLGDLSYISFGDLTEWLSNKLSIASATIEFKSKNNIELNELEKIIVSLLRLNFVKEVYNYSIKVTLDKINAEDMNSLLKSLPPKIKDNIMSSDENMKAFLKLFNSIQSDEELLLLVNKANHLSKDYHPDDLVEINSNYASGNKVYYLRKIITQDLKEMFSAAGSENIILKIVSAYRSYEDQKNVFAQWEKALGEEEAKKVSALAGASQHQLGTTVDLNSLEYSFGNTKEGKWLADNAYKYGFIMSYPEGQEELTGYKYEPWHFRYIGKDASLLVYKYFDNKLEIFLNWYWELKLDK